MSNQPATSPDSIDLTAPFEREFWERTDRDQFLYATMLDAAKMLHRRHLPIPEPAELARIVTLAYQSMWSLCRSARWLIGPQPHVDRFIVDAVRGQRLR